MEVVSDLTTEAFVAALKRFIAYRGKPLIIWSDHGTNFVGAVQELKVVPESNCTIFDSLEIYVFTQLVQGLTCANRSGIHLMVFEIQPCYL